MLFHFSRPCALVCSLQLTAFLIPVLESANSQASVIVDFSPDTTSGTFNGFLGNKLATQIIGDQFTVTSDTLLTGGSVFGQPASQGLAVRFLIYNDTAGIPDATPLLNIATTLDLVDTQYTLSQSSLRRKHASIAPTLLTAGTYWFSLPGEVLDNDVRMGVYSGSDPRARFGHSGSISLTNNLSDDMFFQLEGSAVPEPSSFLILAAAAAGGGFYRRRRNNARTQAADSE